MLLLILEFIGTQELLLIMVVALVIFGPRKLPELGRSIGKSLNEFKRASDDFKRTWETEVEIEKAEKQTPAELMTATALPAPTIREEVKEDDGAIRVEDKNQMKLFAATPSLTSSTTDLVAAQTPTTDDFSPGRANAPADTVARVKTTASANHRDV